MKFGGVLRKSRKEIDLTQEDMAQLLNFSRSNVSKLEIDFSELKAETLVHWGRAIALFRSGQAATVCEAAALAVNTIDAQLVLEAIIQVFAGFILWM